LTNIFQEDNMPGSGLRFAFKESVSCVTATKPNDLALGTVRYEAYNSEMSKWKYVYNGGNSQINPTYGCTILSGASGAYTMTLSSLASQSVCQGIVVHSTLTTSTYGWVMTEGACTFEMGDNVSFAAGEAITLGANGVGASALSFVAGTGTTLTMRPVLGQTPAALASGASGIINLRV
jgi:hypothetical protein